MAGKNATPVLTRMPAAKSLAKPKTLAFVPAPKIELVPVATEPAAPVLVLASAVSSGGAYRFKHALDFMLALVAAILTLPIVAVVSLVSALMFRAQPFFTQERVGANGVVFRVIKIRSLPKATAAYADREQLGVVSVGRWGSFIRSTHIDELPQFWHVLSGKMSMVGPRPMIQSIVVRMHPHHEARRHSVRPGVTGLWQISEAGSRLVLEAGEYDGHYVEAVNLRLDCWILWTTVKQCLGGKQIAFAEMPAWVGIAPTASAATVTPCLKAVAATSNER
jgi:hypothetical protein